MRPRPRSLIPQSVRQLQDRLAIFSPERMIHYLNLVTLTPTHVCDVDPRPDAGVVILQVHQGPGAIPLRKVK